MLTITLCSSVSFYSHVIAIKNKLALVGFKVLVPDLALRMERRNDFSFQKYQESYNDSDPHLKKNLIDEHFQKIDQGDAVLIVNRTKNKTRGYVGPNVLMEMNYHGLTPVES